MEETRWPINTNKLTTLDRNAEEIRQLLRGAAEHIVEIGQKLIEAKAEVGQDNFGNWLHTEIGISESLASKFIQAVIGSPRNGSDEALAVMTLLGDEEWQKWTIRKIAQQCGVSESLVEVIRIKLAASRLAAGMETIGEIGEALAAIRDGHLYCETHIAFDDYCRERFKLSPELVERALAASNRTNSGQEKNNGQ